MVAGVAVCVCGNHFRLAVELFLQDVFWFAWQAQDSGRLRSILCGRRSTMNVVCFVLLRDQTGTAGRGSRKVELAWQTQYLVRFSTERNVILCGGCAVLGTRLRW